MKAILTTFLTLTFIMAASGQPATDDYSTEFGKWHQERMESLRSATGWLNLAGIFWLREGENTFGASGSNNIVFPAGKCPEQLGVFSLENGNVSLQPAAGQKIRTGGAVISGKTSVFPSDKQVIMEHGPLRWFVIRRGDRYAVRLRDLEHPALATFRGVETYMPDTAWIFRARLERTVGKKIPITNVLGQVNMMESPGTLVFTHKGTAYRLDAVEDDGKLFILFSDETSGSTTYGTGRFLYAEIPGSDNYTVLDFNKAINPPCAFTVYATCPLPPAQNSLPFAVTAGEKRYGEH
jgi:uncharacterized protein (DUF1684 family)